MVSCEARWWAAALACAVLAAAAVPAASGDPSDPRPPGRAGGPQDARPPPNLIVLLVDTLRADHVSVYAGSRPATPEVAAFAEEAVVFERAASQASCTFPSVNSLLTSRLPVEFLEQPDRRLGIPPAIPSVASILAERSFETHAISASPIVRKTASEHNPHGGFEAGFQTFDETCEWRAAACLFRRVRDLLPELGRPFFLYLHFMDPHGRYAPPRKFERRFAKEYEGNKDFIARGDPRPVDKMLSGRGPKLSVTSDDIQHLRDLYADEVAFFDQQFGRLVALLRSEGVFDDTLIVLASDHGEEFLEHGRVKHCRSLYDTLIHVPLLLRLPGGAARGRRAQLVQNLDVVPTLLDYLGVDPVPLSLAGRSLRSVIESDAPLREYTYSTQGTLRSLRGDRYKLILDLASGKTELFDLRSDPGETHDLGDTLQGLRDRLRAELEARVARSESGRGDGIPGSDLEERLRALGYLD